MISIHLFVALFVFCIAIDNCIGKTTPPPCSERGTVVNGNCKCKHGYRGDTCENETKCGPHGKLQHDETCKCHDRWTGNTCREIQCSGGKQIANKTRCECFPGVRGDHCQSCEDTAAGCVPCVQLGLESLSIWTKVFFCVFFLLAVVYCIRLLLYGFSSCQNKRNSSNDAAQNPVLGQP